MLLSFYMALLGAAPPQTVPGEWTHSFAVAQKLARETERDLLVALTHKAKPLVRNKPKLRMQLDALLRKR